MTRISEKRIAASKPKRADRLKRRLDRECRRIAEIEKARGRSANLAIFRQVAARLPHEPDRRRRLALAGERGKEGFALSAGLAAPRRLPCGQEWRKRRRGGLARVAALTRHSAVRSPARGGTARRPPIPPRASSRRRRNGGLSLAAARRKAGSPPPPRSGGQASSIRRPAPRPVRRPAPRGVKASA